MFLQKTIRNRAEVEGVGLHSGARSRLTFVPAPVSTGVHFVRTDLAGRPSLKVHAENVSATSYATTISGPAFSVSTIEHCLAALSALRIDNLFVELDGPEIPICDGSAFEFLQAIQASGVLEQDQPRKYCYIRDIVEVAEGDKWARVLPYQGLRLNVEIDFPQAAIGQQALDIDINEASFTQDIAKARTFGFLEDVENLQKKGLARGGSLANAIVVSGAEILNPEGLRWSNEFVRHKVLDALGDLVTLTMPLMGQVVLHKAGHDLMNKLVRKILQSPGAYRLVELGADLADEQRALASVTLRA